MQKWILHFQPIYGVALINLMGFSLLFFYKAPFEKWTAIFGLLLILVIALTYLLIKVGKMGDEYLFILSSMLVSLGIIMLYRLDRGLAIKQMMWLAAGITIFLCCYYLYLKVNLWPHIPYAYAGFSYGIFLLTLLLGSDIKGANNWILIGGFSMQPSEIIKVLFIFFAGAYFVNPHKFSIEKLRLFGKVYPLDHRLVFTLLCLLFLGFLVLQREWGSAILFFGVYFVFLYVFGFPPKFLLINAVVALAGVFSGYLLLHHIRVRMEIWLDPWQDIANKGYQITQSLFAIASGGFFGTGLGMGRPDFIPEVHTDFIFAAICEEMGIFGGIAVILMYFILIYRGFKISLAATDTFDKSVALGLTLMLGFQTFIILGGVTQLIPLTGITLPFVSYGGSSLISSLISLGFLQAISKKSE